MEGDGSDAPVSGAAGGREGSAPGAWAPLPAALRGREPFGGARAAGRRPRFLFAFPVRGRFCLPVRPLSAPRRAGLRGGQGPKEGALGCGSRPSSEHLACGSPGGALPWSAGCRRNALSGVGARRGSGRASRRPLSASAEVGARGPGPARLPCPPAEAPPRLCRSRKGAPLWQPVGVPVVLFEGVA